jgi:hypothetical protein
LTFCHQLGSGLDQNFGINLGLGLKKASGFPYEFSIFFHHCFVDIFYWSWRGLKTVECGGGGKVGKVIKVLPSRSMFAQTPRALLKVSCFAAAATG